MLGLIAAVMIIVSVIFSFFNGRTDDVLYALLSGGGDAVTLCIKIAGSLCFFSGLIRIAEKSGVTSAVSRFLRPLIRFLMPSAVGIAEEAACMNITSNLFGLGNAATPMGIRAVREMYTKNSLKNPDRSVAVFVVLNTSSITLIPTTIMAIRAAAGAESPFSILPKIFFVQIVSCVIGIIAVFIAFPRKKDKNER